MAPPDDTCRCRQAITTIIVTVIHYIILFAKKKKQESGKWFLFFFFSSIDIWLLLVLDFFFLRSDSHPKKTHKCFWRRTSNYKKPSPFILRFGSRQLSHRFTGKLSYFSGASITFLDPPSKILITNHCETFSLERFLTIHIDEFC